MKKKHPWYLRKGALYSFCIVIPPIGYLIVITNLKRFEYEEKMDYLLIATIMASFWVLKFLPDPVADYFWAAVLAIIIGSTILKFWDRRKE